MRYDSPQDSCCSNQYQEDWEHHEGLQLRGFLYYQEGLQHLYYQEYW